MRNHLNYNLTVKGGETMDKIEKSAMVKNADITPEEMELINAHTLKELSAEDVFVFKLILCDNEIDRDNEKFTVSALHKLGELFIGKTGIFDHNMKSHDQTARIFSTAVISDETRKTADGETYTYEITPQMLYVFTPVDIFKMAAGFALWLKDKREELHLNIPHFTPKESEENAGYSLPVMTFEEKIIRDYCGLSFKEIDELCIFEYWQLLRDAILCDLKKTPGGRELMEEAYCFEQTEPDREALFERGMRVAE